MSAYDQKEIDNFKAIDIRVFLPELGWAADPIDRYKRVTYTRDGRIVKAWGPSSGVWRVTDHGEGLPPQERRNFLKKSYTVIDLAFEVVGDQNWKGACGLLRGILGTAANDQPSTFSKHSTQTSPDQSKLKVKRTEEEIKSAYMNGSVTWSHGDPIPDYLLKRGISRLSPAFERSFRVSHNGNIRFPHRYLVGGKEIMGGIERRGEAIKGLYTAGGTNGIWRSVGFPMNGALVVVESQIDAMSYDVLMNPDGPMYISIRAGTEHIAVEFIRKLLEMEKINRVVVATDNDHAGLAYAGRILSGLVVDRKVGEKYYMNCSALYQPPVNGYNDWNDALRAQSLAKNEL